MLGLPCSPGTIANETKALFFGVSIFTGCLSSFSYPAIQPFGFSLSIAFSVSLRRPSCPLRTLTGEGTELKATPGMLIPALFLPVLFPSFLLFTLFWSLFLFFVHDSLHSFPLPMSATNTPSIGAEYHKCRNSLQNKTPRGAAELGTGPVR